MAESLTTVLRQTLERYVCEEVTKGDLRQINCHTAQKTNPARRRENRLHLASRWMLMPRSKTFYLMPKNVAMESNMTSTDQLMENSLKLFKI